MRVRGRVPETRTSGHHEAKRVTVRRARATARMRRRRSRRPLCRLGKERISQVKVQDGPLTRTTSKAERLTLLTLFFAVKARYPPRSLTAVIPELPLQSRPGARRSTDCQ